MTPLCHFRRRAPEPVADLDLQSTVNEILNQTEWSQIYLPLAKEKVTRSANIILTRSLQKNTVLCGRIPDIAAMRAAKPGNYGAYQCTQYLPSQQKEPARNTVLRAGLTESHKKFVFINKQWLWSFRDHIMCCLSKVLKLYAKGVALIRHKCITKRGQRTPFPKCLRKSKPNTFH